ncbi:FG-GAP repeat domain-containing protein [Streptomyces sp. NPDC051563]|uniref:FG-GAP repeat domain-containing protein n=1 Tax=Streptomyces sp. NPDC051563 TaxID=3365659 RepID=UPI0037B40473
MPLAAGAKEAVIKVVPILYPQSTLTVIAFDKAGNHSPTDSTKESTVLPTTRASFVYPTGKTPLSPAAERPIMDRRGDLNGDGYPDMLATEPGGGLRSYTSDGTGHVTSSIIGASGWGKALIAHGGDYTNASSSTDVPDGYEDAIVRLDATPYPNEPNRKNLYLYPGNGQGALAGAYRRVLPAPSRLGKEGWARLQQIIAPGDIDQRTDAGHLRGNDLLALECVYDEGECTGNVSLRIYSGRTKVDGSPNQNDPFGLLADANEPFELQANPADLDGPIGGWGRMTVLAVGDQNNDKIMDIVARDKLNNDLHLYRGKMTNGVYSLESGTAGQGDLYGASGWGDGTRPLLATSGNAQGAVVDKTVTDDDGTKLPYQEFQTKAGDEPGDLWATTPNDPDRNYTVKYVDSAGNPQTTTCPTGCLLFYPGGATSNKSPLLVGASGWSTSISGIF